MHTYVLSKIIDKNMYDKIINSTPHYFLETTSTHFSLAIIINDRLSIPDDEKNSLPAIYLYCFEETKIINGKKIKTGIYHHMLELRINYTKIIGNTGFYSIPVEFTKSIVHQSIIDLVCKAVPEIYELNDNLISLYSHLKLIYQKIYPKHPIPDIVDIVTTLSKSNDEQIQQFMKNHFSEPQIFSMDISKETKQRIIDHDYPLEFLLKRIDYSCDIYTDYKNILLGLISKGYDVKQFADDTRIYYNKEEDIIESNYYKSKSVHINIYDKFSELKTHNEYILPEDEDRLPYLLRFEVQLLKNRLSYLKQREINKNGKQIERKLDDFISNNKEYENLNYYMKRLIGLGNYYRFPVAINIVNDSNYKNNMKKKLCRVLYHVAKRNGIANFLKCVKNGSITDCGNFETAKDYLQKLHAIGVNPVTISKTTFNEMKTIQQRYPMPNLGHYRYGIDFLYNPLIYLEKSYQIAEIEKNNI